MNLLWSPRETEIFFSKVKVYVVRKCEKIRLCNKLAVCRSSCLPDVTACVITAMYVRLFTACYLDLIKIPSSLLHDSMRVKKQQQKNRGVLKLKH